MGCREVFDTTVTHHTVFMDYCQFTCMRLLNAARTKFALHLQ